MQTYTTDAAKACNVSLNTIRNWCRDYGAFLSPGASAIGEARSFTGRDMEVLKYIALLRSEGMQKGAIMQRLGETTFSEIAPDDTIEPTDESTELAPVASQEGLQQAPQSIMVALQHIERRMDAYERRRLDTITAIGLGFVGGLLFCAIVILLAWLYGG
jgi:DNA-binding transcriptional MerR regulator